ncbi:hypothetical protein FO519_004691 [Halicephalobus sp. NKZ332]|nr:hypothetical protein FO519_004691 [Halicephalobus sp. NKZ332]
MSEGKKRSSSDLVDCEKASRGVWLVKVPRYLSEIWEKNAGNDVGWLKQVGEDEVNFVSNNTTMEDSAPKPKPVAPIPLPGTSVSTMNGRADLRKVPDLSELKPLGAAAKEITVPKEHRFKFTRLDQSLGILLEDKTMLKEEAELKSGKVTIEGRVVKRAEIQPPATKEYMMMKRTMICKASQPMSVVKKVDRPVNTFKPRAIQAELMQKQKAKKEIGIRSVRGDHGLVTDQIFRAFEKHEFYRAVDLAKVTGQPVNYVKDILTNIGVYNTAPPHKNLWCLKPEYKA